MELAIQILEAMESSDRAIVEMGQQLLEDVEVDDERYRYHCLMLAQAELIRLWPIRNVQELIDSGHSYVDTDNAIIEEHDSHDRHAIFAHPLMLTYDGHKFLETIRNEDTRNKIRTSLTEHGLPFALSTVKEVGLKFLTG